MEGRADAVPVPEKPLLFRFSGPWKGEAPGCIQRAGKSFEVLPRSNFRPFRRLPFQNFVDNSPAPIRLSRTASYCPNMTDLAQLQTLARLNVSQAAKAVGKARSTINRDIDNGKVSVTRNGKGQPFIEIAELERVYGDVSIETVTEPVQFGHSGTPKNDNLDSALIKEIELLRERLADKDSVIDDLRRRLDTEGEERRKLTALLTDQREKPAAEPAPAPRGFRAFLHRLTG